MAKSFREAVLTFAWMQWNDLGVFASAENPDAWCHDVEALLIFTLEVGRRDPRVFDEIQDWLCLNVRWLSIQRLRNLLRPHPESVARLVGAALAIASEEARSPSAAPKLDQREPEPLFGSLSEHDLTDWEPDAIFFRFGFRRPRFVRSYKSKPPDPLRPSNFALRLRAVFGAGTRSEALRYLVLMGGERCTMAEVAHDAAFSKRKVQDALSDLAAAGVCERIKRGNEYLWAVPMARWLAFLGAAKRDLPSWMDWQAIFRGLSLVWRFLDEARGQSNRYLLASDARRVMAEAAPLLRGLHGWKPTEGADLPGELYLDAFSRDLEAVIALLRRGRARAAR
ncbi:MAG: hypothetical protein FJZ01_08175 [Candidatus Sericytochromatia bacterium]|nr:hypothetical protein [Candidatus Tanganyikabacteria bacterium]